MRRTTAVLIVAAFLTFCTAINAHAHPSPLFLLAQQPDVRATADMAVTFYAPGAQLATDEGASTTVHVLPIKTDALELVHDGADLLCDGYRPSDLEAWDIATGRRMGDDRLRYVPSLAPGILPGVIVSRYQNPVRVWGWCG